MTEICSSSITNLNNILRKLIASSDHLSGSELAKRCGIPVSTVNRILAGTVIDPKISTLKPLADYFGVSVDQLLGYAALPEKFNRHNQKIKPSMALPVFQIKNFQSPSQNTNQWFTWVSDKPTNNETFAISIETNEFEPIFSKDSILIVEPSMLPPQNNDYVAVIFEPNNTIAIKKYKVEEDDYYFLSLNPQIQALLCSSKKYHLLGVISEAHTKLREF